MTKVNLNNEPNEIITGNDNIVIAKYLDGIDGGRSLDVTGYPLKVIKAGVPAITDGAGTYKPMPLMQKELHLRHFLKDIPMQVLLKVLSVLQNLLLQS